MKLQEKSIGRILYPSDYWASDPAAQLLFTNFVDALARFAHAKKVSKSLAELWSEAKPTSVHFHSYFEKVCSLFVACLSKWLRIQDFHNTPVT